MLAIMTYWIIKMKFIKALWSTMVSKKTVYSSIRVVRQAYAYGWIDVLKHNGSSCRDYVLH